MNLKNTIIEVLALYGKVCVESSSLNEQQKTLSKFEIDVVKEVIKEKIKTLEEELIYFAKLCGIKKIKYSIYLFLNNRPFWVLSIEGGNINQFCDLMGLTLLSQTQQEDLSNRINKNTCVLLEEKTFFIN
jgi:hypothetical protein